MDTDTATNPAGGEDNAEATLPDESEVDSSLSVDNESELDPDALAAEDESEEIEHDGRKYSVPKALKPLMLMQADYTRKTQEVAEQRNALAAERQAMHQISQAEFQAAAHAQTLGQQIAQYQNTDWRAWHDSDPFAAAAATSDYQMLRDAHAASLNYLAQLRQHRLSTAQQETARRIEQGRAALSNEIPGWDEDLKAKLIGFAAGYGFSRDELDDLEADPRVAKVLHAAFAGSKAATTAKTAQMIAAQEAVQPAAKVRAKGAPPAGLDDRLSSDEWMRRRNAQTRKRA